MHGVIGPAEIVDTALKSTFNYKPAPDNPPSNPPLFGLKENFKEVFDFVDMQNKISNSRQTSERLNFLECQVGYLQQQVASYEKRFADLLLYNWLFPKGAIQGIGGYVCKKCQTFSLKAIFDPGYDMTRERKHRCNYSADKRSYIVFSIPSYIQNVDDWPAQTMLNQVNFSIPIGKYLLAKDIPKGLNDLSNNLDPEIAQEILGVPDKYHFYSLENNDKLNWIDRAIDNLAKKIVMADNEVLDFFREWRDYATIFYHFY
jgi:hypothetical protein